MRQATGELAVETGGQGLHEVTRAVGGWVEAQGLRDGLLTIFCRHTSASLLIQENAAPAARRDLEAYFARIAPESPAYEQVQLSIPLTAGRLVLGTWQGIYLFEHRRSPQRRRLALHLLGE